MEICKQCGGKLILGKTYIEIIDPDQEPYEDGEREKLELIDCDICFNLHYCPNCEIIRDIWDDEKVHLTGDSI